MCLFKCSSNKLIATTYLKKYSKFTESFFVYSQVDIIKQKKYKHTEFDHCIYKKHFSFKKCFLNITDEHIQLWVI